METSVVSSGERLRCTFRWRKETQVEDLVVVKGVGPSRPTLIHIGEAPGEEEVNQGIPFVGNSGQTLDKILMSAGVQRSDCYLDNIIPIRPPLNKMERLGELGASVEMFLPNVREYLSKVDCPVIVAYGDTAMYHLTGKGDITKKGEISGISKHRGSVYPCILDSSKIVVPTFHPRFINENWKMRGVVVEDVKKALRIRKEGYNEPTFNTIIKPSFSETCNCIEEIRGRNCFSFDIEVVGSGQIACIGFGYYTDLGHTRRSICIPLKFGFRNYWEELEEWHIWELLRELFQGDQLKIGQNLNYDLSKLLPFIGEPAPPWCDLMMAHHLLEAELPHSLAFMTSLYTWPPVNYYKDDPKDEDKSWKYTTSSEMLWEYNGKDVEVPLMIEPIFTKELKEMGMLSFFQGFQMSKTRVLWRIQQRGMLLDEEKRGELLTIQTEQLANKQKALNEIVGYPLNVNSHKQMVKFLYQDLKLPIQRDRKTKKASTGEEALNKLYAYHPDPVFGLALNIRESVKEIGTYLMVEPESDGKVRGRYNAAGTTTGRSSSKKNYDGRGLDWHNIPEGDRQMFIAPEGSSFIVRDLWQAEMFVVAVLSQCQAFLSKLMKGEKVHKLVASWIFGIPEDKVDNNNKPGGQYYTGKRSGHGFNYGLGPILLAINLKCDVKTAKHYRDTYFRYAFEIENWHKEIQETLKQTRMLITPFGRKRYFRGRWGEELFKQGYSHIPQSLVAELNHLGMIKLEYMLPPAAEILQEGYDSLLVEVKDELIDTVKEVMEKAFDKEIYSNGMFFRIPGEVTINKRWLK
jgi:uracil-DNA glycosylase family 4